MKFANRTCSRVGFAIIGAASLLGTGNRARAQTPSPAYQSRARVTPIGSIPGHPTQMAWGPDGRLYVMTDGAGVHSLAYNAATGQLTDDRVAVSGVAGIGIAFHQSEMYLSIFDGSSSGGHGALCSLMKLTDTNHNGVWGETGETRVKIVTGIAAGDHDVDQIQIKGDTLYVGIGRRTINGRRGAGSSGSIDDFGGNGFWGGGTGTTWGDCAFGGTIAMIPDLTHVVDTEGSANAYAAPTLTQTLVQTDTSPLTATVQGNKLVVHSAGTRNPFGLCFDRDGQLWFTSNFNRTRTNGDGTSGVGYVHDSLGPDFSKDVHDQVFKAVAGADYGYADDNWRGVNPMLTPAAQGYQRVRATAFDNLFNPGPTYTLHDPANPDGLGPSASADGCGFFYAWGTPTELANSIYVARYNHSITENGNPSGTNHTLTYADIVAVNPTTGKVRRIAEGFNNPLAVLSDNAQRLLIADYNSGNGNNGQFYALTFASRLDFNGDGKPDLLWQNANAGSLIGWQMDGTTAQASTLIGSGIGAEWEVAGRLDVNGDGQGDIVWRNQNTGDVVYWTMNQTTVTGSGVLASAVSPDWQIVGIGDLNGSGSPGLLWQNVHTGTAIYWYFDNGSLLSTGTQPWPGAPWHIRAVADLDGDGKADLIWQNEDTGAVAVWYMSGLVPQSSQLIVSTMPTVWRVAGAADLNNDGQIDLLWQNASLGEVHVWFQDHGAFTSQALIASNLGEWTLCGLR